MQVLIDTVLSPSFLIGLAFGFLVYPKAKTKLIKKLKEHKCKR